MRGLWRWWETKNGSDVWWARVETTPGAWADFSEADYTARSGAPAFWDLPLKEEVVAQAATDPLDAHWLMEQRAGEGVTLGLMLAGGIAFVLLVVGAAVMGWRLDWF